MKGLALLTLLSVNVLSHGTLNNNNFIYRFNKAYSTSNQITINKVTWLSNSKIIVLTSQNKLVLLTKNNTSWVANELDLNITRQIVNTFSFNNAESLIVTTKFGFYVGELQKDGSYKFSKNNSLSDSDIIAGQVINENTMYLLSSNQTNVTAISKVVISDKSATTSLVYSDAILNDTTSFNSNIAGTEITFFKNNLVYSAKLVNQKWTYSNIATLNGNVQHLRFTNEGNTVVYSNDTFNIYASDNLLSNDRKFQSISLSDEVTSISPTYSQNQAWFTTNNQLYDLTYANSKFSITNQPKYTDIPTNNLTYINNDSSNYNLYLVSDNSLYYGYLTNPPAPPKPPAKSNGSLGLILGLTLGIGSFVIGGLSLWIYVGRRKTKDLTK